MCHQCPRNLTKSLNRVIYIFGPPPEVDLGPMNSPPCVRPSITLVFSKTAHWIFLIFVMKLLWDECTKVTFLFFDKNS